MKAANSISPMLTSLPNLLATFEPLHRNEKGEIEYLIDVWLACAPEINIAQKAIVDRLPYDGYDPRTDNITRRWVFGVTLFKWIKYISKRRGFPFEDVQILDMLNGEVNYGI